MKLCSFKIGGGTGPPNPPGCAGVMLVLVKIPNCCLISCFAKPVVFILQKENMKLKEDLESYKLFQSASTCDILDLADLVTIYH